MKNRGTGDIPARHGELRWFTTLDGKDVELPNGDPVQVDGELIRSTRVRGETSSGESVTDAHLVTQSDGSDDLEFP